MLVKEVTDKLVIEHKQVINNKVIDKDNHILVNTNNKEVVHNKQVELMHKEIQEVVNMQKQTVLWKEVKEDLVNQKVHLEK